MNGTQDAAARATQGVSDARCEELFDLAQTPDNVRAHCATTAAICERMARRLNEHGYSLDVQLCRSGGMLHDIKRVERNHSRRGAEFLRAQGLDALAQIVHEHDGFFGIYPTDFTEESIVCFADKLAQNDQVVTLDQRYAKALEKTLDNPPVHARLELDLAILKRMKARYEKITGDVII